MNPQLGQYTLLLGFLMPLVVSVVLQCHWRQDVKALVAILVCSLAAIGQLSLQGQLNTGNLVDTTLAVFALSTTFLHLFWKKVPWFAGLEEKTTILPAPSTTESPTDPVLPFPPGS